MRLCPQCGQAIDRDGIISPQIQFALDAYLKAFREWEEQHKDDPAPEPEPKPKWPD